MSSNIFKNGFDNIKTISTDPFVIDTNSRVIETPQGRVIRSQKEIKENAPESEKEDVKKPDNEELLGDAMDKAQDILEESREKANAILAQAQQEADALMEQAKQEGYNRGLEEGNMEAMKRADVYQMIEEVTEDVPKTKKTNPEPGEPPEEAAEIPEESPQEVQETNTEREKIRRDEP